MIYVEANNQTIILNHTVHLILIRTTAFAIELRPKNKRKKEPLKSSQSFSGLTETLHLTIHNLQRRISTL